jgi:hypothetical protein
VDAVKPVPRKPIGQRLAAAATAVHYLDLMVRKPDFKLQLFEQFVGEIAWPPECAHNAVLRSKQDHLSSVSLKRDFLHFTR